MNHPVLGPITRRMEYDAHPVGKRPITYNNTDRPAQRGNIQLLGGKTGYNDDARYCLVLAAKVDGHTCYMSFLANEGKMTRFGDVARVADWIIAHRPKVAAAAAPPAAPAAAALPLPSPSPSPAALPVFGVPLMPAGAATPAAPVTTTTATAAAEPHVP
jgi:D-alanyl-D-alanine carboxypeptidase